MASVSKQFAAIGFLILGAVTAAAADQFTAAERTQIAELAANFEATCKEHVKSFGDPLPAEAPAVIRWRSQFTDTEAFCSCTAEKISTLATPATLRTKTGAGIEEAMKRAGTTCAVPAMKATFKNFCFDMVAEIPGASREANDRSVAFCGCVQAEIDKITVDDFESFYDATTRDYQAFLESRKLLSTPGSNSLVATMNRCDASSLKKP